METITSPIVQQIDQQISRAKSELTRLEQARNLLVASEPGVVRSAATLVSKGRRTRPALKGRRGRPKGTTTYKANTTTDAPAKRGRGRPKGSKNKPKVQPADQTAPAPVSQISTTQEASWASDGQ